MYPGGKLGAGKGGEGGRVACAEEMCGDGGTLIGVWGDGGAWNGRGYGRGCLGRLWDGVCRGRGRGRVGKYCSGDLEVLRASRCASWLF